MTDIKGIIYDLDGTLVSSSLNFKAMRQAVGCPEEQDMLAYIEAIKDPKQKHRAQQLVWDHEHQDAQQANWLPGAKQLVNSLHALDLPQAIVTRNNQSAAQIKITNNQIPIELVISREHYPAKPDPSALLAIANQWQLPPAQILYIGDFRYDIEAGNNAGMISVLVHARQPNDDQHQADFNFENLTQLQTWLSQQTSAP